jgi:cell division protein FtsZ
MHGIQSITDLMVRPGLINLDFADVETVMSSMGKAIMGTGQAEGDGRAIKAAEMAISNPLIDDYTLKGAKGLLVNITGGKDLKLFEVDEAVNKVRSEVDPEAELIIGAITDENLDGAMRVSIVATSLDGQQPEPKSVINMVHRIQNRNPGYSDFSNTGSIQSFSFSNPHNSIITNGANALKLEKEVKIESLETSQVNDMEVSNSSTILNEEIEPQSQNIENEINALDEKKDNEIKSSTSNGLENFDFNEEEAPELFNSENTEDSFSSLDTENNKKEEDELEIPAFLRRQKN